MNLKVSLSKLLFITFFTFSYATYSQVVINEIMLNPQTSSTSSQFQSLKMCSQITYGNEYIELYNSSACPIDISCYLIGFNGNFGTGIEGTFRFPTGTIIAPNGFLSIGGPNSGATLDLTSFCTTANLETDADRWFIPNGDGYMMLWDENGIALDAVYWTVNANEGTKWGTDTDIQLAPTTIAAGTTCTLVSTLLGPSDIPLSSGIVSYAGEAPQIGTVIHRTVDGGATWVTDAVATINACNGACQSATSSILTNTVVTQPTCNNADGSITLNPSPADTYTYSWSNPISNTTNTASSLAQGTYTITITNSLGCVTDTTIILVEDCGGCNLAATVSVVPNSACAPCNYSGPTILINELMISPSAFDGSLSGSGGVSDGRGEWIELFNPNWCDSVDISCYYLGNSAPGSLPGTQPGGYVIPQGTVIPPLGLAMIRGFNATPVPANLLVQNGGNVVELVVPYNTNEQGVCIGGGASRLWFPNAGGWFAFYDSQGVPQDAVSWANGGSTQDKAGNPCIAQLAPCNFSGQLASYNQIPSNRKAQATTVDASSHTGQSIRRIPDGGAWIGPSTPTYATCNDPANCALITAIANCNGTATVNVTSGTAPFTYQWNDPLNQTTQTAANLCDGVYQVLVTDADLCTQTYSATVITNPFDLTAIIVQPGCNANDGSIAFTPFEPTYTYSWTPNVSTTNVASNLAPGTYDLTITEGTCSFDTTVILVNPAAFTTTVSQVNTTCGLDNGSINVEVTPSTGTYSFTWTPNVSTVDSAFAIPAGDYSIVITDNICATTQNVTILSSEELSSTAQITHTSCAQSDGAINIDVNPPSQYYYTWTSNVSTVDSATNLASGTYLINVTDSVCFYDTTIVVNASYTPTDLLANITASNCGTSNGEIQISQTDGGIAPYQYSFSGMSFSNNMSIDSLGAGSYIVAVQDANGCEYQESFIVPEIPGPSQILFTEQNPNCGYNNGIIEIVDGVGGVEPYTYTFNNQAVGNLIQSDLFNGNYTIIASDFYGCTTSENILLTMEAGLSIVYIPNVFTPNSDNALTNEVWKVSATCTQTFNCKIFNRWGSLIYEFNDLNGEWNGKTTKGEDVSDGVYFYKVELGYFDGRSEIFQGHITVIR
jgi:gliding motility-associated-like protein